MRLATVVSTSKFDTEADKLLTAEGRAALEFSLAKGPEAHPQIPGLNGVRKVRWVSKEVGSAVVFA